MGIGIRKAEAVAYQLMRDDSWLSGCHLTVPSCFIFSAYFYNRREITSEEAK